jgi:hypothetical protein
MSNSQSGFQLLASVGMGSGQGLLPQNITANLASYNAISTVNNWRSIYFNANAAGVFASNTIALRSIGTNVFPGIFGQTPFEYSSSLGTGPLFDKIIPRISNWFGNINSSSIFIQVLNQAQIYASQSADLINSAASTQWVNGAASTATGGFSSIADTSINIVGQSFENMGSTMQLSSPLNGFSNAGCFQQLIDSGNETIGNLHLNFFGKTIIDPSTGTQYIIGKDLFQLIINDPRGRTSDDTFQIAALNPLDVLIGEVANTALIDTGNLDAVVSYFEVSGSQINQWTDCLNIPLMLGVTASNAIMNAQKISTLDAYSLIFALVSSLKGLSNLKTIADLGKIMTQIVSLPSSSLSDLSSPISSSQYANLQIQLGPGSGANLNPTVADILGNTDLNGVLSNTIFNLISIKETLPWANISSDSGNVANALINGISGNVYLSNGTVYTDINSLSSNAVELINQQANLLSNYISADAFDSYNKLAETHNNSIQLVSKAGINVANLKSSNILAQTFPSELATMALGNDEITGLDVVTPLFDSTITGQALSAIIVESQNNQTLLDAGLETSSFDSNPTTL